MPEPSAAAEPWWVNGLLYENCNCQLLCPAHISFRQRCEEERCLGFWGVRVGKGRFGPLVLGPQDAVILYESPPLMHDGGWTVRMVFDAAVDTAQREALRRILEGAVGGPWAVIARFFAHRIEPILAPFRFEDDGRRKRLSVEGVLDTVIESVESKRTGQTATLGNLFNVVHSTIQYLAHGSSRVTADRFDWTTSKRHALYSEFSWTGP